jgi:hypothetical protein
MMSFKKSTGETEKAYLAGHPDARASFVIRIRHQTKRSKNAIHTYIRICEDKQDPLVMLKGYFGGTIRIAEPSGMRTKSLYRWYLNRQESIVYFIRTVLPYLRFNTKQAALLLKYCESRLKATDEISTSPITREERKMAVKLMEMNNRQRKPYFQA